jgi:hypothetical protein
MGYQQFHRFRLKQRLVRRQKHAGIHIPQGLQTQPNGIAAVGQVVENHRYTQILAQVGYILMTGYYYTVRF